MPRLNRNGIPVLDPEGVNHLPKRCHPSMHQWRKTGEALADQDWIMGLDHYRDEYRCRVCGAVSYEYRSEVNWR